MRVECASLRRAKLRSQLGLSRFLSGCSLSASLLYAFLICASVGSPGIHAEGEAGLLPWGWEREWGWEWGWGWMQNTRGKGSAQRIDMAGATPSSPVGGGADEVTCALLIQPENLVVVWNPPTPPCLSTAARPLMTVCLGHGRGRVSQSSRFDSKIKPIQSEQPQAPSQCPPRVTHGGQ